MGVDAQYRRVVNPGDGSDLYPRTDVVLHWLVAVLVAAAFCICTSMVRLDLPLAVSFALYQSHKSLGLLVLLLMLGRLAWRLVRPPLPLPASIEGSGRRLARIGHLALYGGLLAVPLAGWLLVSVSAFGLPVEWFSLFQVPFLPGFSSMSPERREELEPVVRMVHVTLAWLVAALVVGHVGMVIRHEMAGRGVLRRMAWRRERR